MIIKFFFKYCQNEIKKIIICETKFLNRIITLKKKMNVEMKTSRTNDEINKSKKKILWFCDTNVIFLSNNRLKTKTWCKFFDDNYFKMMINVCSFWKKLIFRKIDLKILNSFSMKKKSFQIANYHFYLFFSWLRIMIWYT